MLKSLDVLIGLTVVLLALSMSVTVITQAITTVLNSRGRHLRRGLTDMLQQLDPALTARASRAIATGILAHPLVSASNRRLGNVVHREEFTKLLMGLACTEARGVNAEAKHALKTALSNNGIKDPAATLKAIRSLALQLERSRPELSNMARQNLAILQAAETDLVAKINNWFDQTMDRTSQRFTASTRGITFVGAFVVAFALQVDTPAVVNRLAADDALRARLVSEAAGVMATRAEQGTPPQSADEIRRKYRELLGATGIITLPSSTNWQGGFTLASALGMLLTALLLSLGAPFWYNALARLLQLRSVLAEKEDAQRGERQVAERK